MTKGVSFTKTPWLIIISVIIIDKGVQIQTDPKNPKTAKNQIFLMSLDVVL